MRDLELWLEAAVESCALPKDCYATVRPVSGGQQRPPTCCTPNEATCLGELDADEGPIVVEIFKRVGTITVGTPLSGGLVEGTVAWPGLPDGALKLKAAVVAVASTGAKASAVPKTPGPPSAEKEKNVQHLDVIPEVVQEVARNIPTPEVEQPTVVANASISAQPSHDPVQMQVLLNNCDQIMTNLYLGGVGAAADTQLLVQQGISAVVCCVRELEFPTREFSDKLVYCRVDVEDMGREPIELYFPEATEFIHSWISRELPVLVHCRAGVSRSASVVIAYLMTYHSLSLKEAFFLVRSRRNIVTPNIGFMEKLADYEAELSGNEPTIDVNKYMGWYQSPERAAVPDLEPD